MNPITSKRQFYELWRAGLLGNRPETWESVEGALASGHQQFGVREAGVAGGGWFTMATRANLPEIVEKWRAAGKRYIIDGGAPNEVVTLQGEVIETDTGVEGLFAIRSGMTIREAMGRGLFKRVCGLRALLLIQQFMDPSSYEDLKAIFELYPRHAVEFACFPCNVGVLPSRNTLFWEVRQY